MTDVTRRDFLRAVGISGGAGAMLSTMGALGLAPAAQAAPAFAPPRPGDFTLTGRRPATVVVLGAGVAGLAAAYELGKAGYDCTVLEARQRTGGRNLTIRGGDAESDLDGHTQVSRFAPGSYFNAGPARIAQWMVTMDYCRELGVPVEVFTNANASALIYNESAGMTPGNPVRYRTAKADVYGYVAELLAKATDQGALDAALSEQDKERLLDFLEDFGDIGDRADGFAYTGSERRGLAVDPGAGEQEGTDLGAPPPLSDVFASGVGRYFSFEFEYDQAMLMFQPIGGMDQIPRALTRAIGTHRVRLGAAVTGITSLADGVRVRYTAGGRTRAIDADFCVATLPPHLLARIPHNLGSEVTAALGDFPATPVGKLGLEYRSRWWETDLRIFGGITETDLDIGHIWYPSHDYFAPRGVLLGYYTIGGAARRYSALSPEQRVERAVAHGVKIHGGKYRSELASGFSVGWHRTPFLEGGWTSPPFGTAAYRRLLEPAGRVFFAGDWLSHAVSWQHGAFVSARAAVTALHQRVMAG